MAGDDTDQDRENYGTSVSRAATHALAGYTDATQAAATTCLSRRKGEGRRPRASADRDRRCRASRLLPRGPDRAAAPRIGAFNARPAGAHRLTASHAKRERHCRLDAGTSILGN